VNVRLLCKDMYRYCTHLSIDDFTVSWPRFNWISSANVSNRQTSSGIGVERVSETVSPTQSGVMMNLPSIILKSNKDIFPHI